MKNKIITMAAAKLVPIVLGALGAWVVIQFPSAHAAFCSVRLVDGV